MALQRLCESLKSMCKADDDNMAVLVGLHYIKIIIYNDASVDR